MIENEASGDAQEVRTWRGRRVLSEEEVSKMDCPYPPEPDWGDLPYTPWRAEKLDENIWHIYGADGRLIVEAHLEAAAPIARAIAKLPSLEAQNRDLEESVTVLQQQALEAIVQCDKLLEACKKVKGVIGPRHLQHHRDWPLNEVYVMVCAAIESVEKDDASL
jgi:hypothetical protein